MLKITVTQLKLITLLLTASLLSGCAAVVVGGAATSAVVAANDRRTTGTIIEDKSIQLKSLQAITEVADDPNVHVSAISYNNQVLLVGQAPSHKVRADIVQRVKNIEKVKKVHNEITLKEPTSMLQRSTDTWITTRVKSEMTVTKDLNPARVKVVTEDGVVYLLGIVKPIEEEITVDIARHVKGVNKVVKIFEYDRT